MEQLARYLLGLALLVATTQVLTRIFSLRLGALPVTAILRAVVQLGLIALVLRGIISFSWAAPLFFVLMLSTAAYTSGRHTRPLHRGPAAATAGLALGAVLTVTAIFVLGLVPFSTQNFIAMSGIIIGGTMTAVTFTARNFISQCEYRVGEIEGWWALGTLPGTFVGALMGGAPPLLAAQMQIAVLAGQTLSGLIASLVFTAWISRARQLPARRTPPRVNPL
ncbi:hypothetical protein GCM10007359_11790 [Rothia aerolata]|uniref:Uncharacterized protein n=1 Tax=Rothia aerolata TaxID=1812262 RepID=A0A917IUC4_9MICC|nr:hypothetical protein GCM10007359_11790 [Rothia aerolata]